MGVPLLIHQPSYSILNRWIEDDETLDICGELGIGVIPFSPLQQGILSGKYSKGRAGTRAEERNSSINARALAPKVLAGVDALGKIAKARKQTLSQLALAWVLRRSEVTSALIGVRTLEQLKDCLGALDNLSFTQKELDGIDAAVADAMLPSRPATTMAD
jgi:L-glyceraldehyde 3-phosphate reductase